MNTKIAAAIERTAISKPPIAGPVSKIVVPTIKLSNVNTKEEIFLIFVESGLCVGIFNINQPIGAPKIEIRIIKVTSSASDSMILV